MNVLTGKVGDELLIPIGLRVEDQCPLLRLVRRPMSLAAQKKAEFQGHVESWEATTELDSREVMNTKTTFRDHALDFGETGFCGVILLQCASGRNAKVVHGKNNSLENRPITLIKWAIDEDVATFDFYL